ncbi:hypothetical protein MKW92_019429 [Papaver armeniacum]|nr:hypothetical protein MKW92_019429 [Papaver armeniacum]
MARFLNKASSSSLLRSLAAAEQEYKNGIFMSSASQFCNFSSKASAKKKSGAGGLTKEDAALQPALSKSKTKTKSSAGSLPKGDIALKPALPKSKAKSKRGARDLAKQDIALQLSLSKSKAKPKAKSSAGKLSKEDIALQQALDKISASFGKGAIMWLGRQDTPKTVPVGRVIEVYGPEASGKTTLALHVIAEAQKQGALSLVDTLVMSGSVKVVVVDSTVGSQVLVNIVMNKHAPPFKAVRFELEFGKGISREGELIELWCKHELITKSEDDALKNYYLAQSLQVREELTVKLREKVLHTDANDEKAAEARGEIRILNCILGFVVSAESFRVEMPKTRAPSKSK